jgi:ribonuclease HI
MLHACQTANEIDPECTKPLHIKTDSKLLANTWNLPSWMERWQQQGWCKADGRAVMNLDLVKQLWKHKQGQRTIKVMWISRWKNEEADQLAKQGSSAAMRAGKGERY